MIQHTAPTGFRELEPALPPLDQAVEFTSDVTQPLGIVSIGSPEAPAAEQPELVRIGEAELDPPALAAYAAIKLRQERRFYRSVIGIAIASAAIGIGANGMVKHAFSDARDEQSTAVPTFDSPRTSPGFTFELPEQPNEGDAAPSPSPTAEPGYVSSIAPGNTAGDSTSSDPSSREQPTTIEPTTPAAPRTSIEPQLSPQPEPTPIESQPTTTPYPVEANPTPKPVQQTPAPAATAAPQPEYPPATPEPAAPPELPEPADPADAPSETTPN